jgi:hypothetical protein
MIEIVINAFVSDIIKVGNTTNEKYYACQEYVERDKETLSREMKVLTDDILKKANQLMWINLTLERANLPDEKQKSVARQKEELLDWFRQAAEKLDEYQKDSNS